MKVKLESFLEEVSERTNINNQYPVLTSSKDGIFLQSDYFNKQVASKDNVGYKIIRRGEFTYRAMSDTGKFYPNALKCTDIGIVSPAYPVFRISKDIILPEYLEYYFKSKAFQKSISSFIQGSTRSSMKFSKMKTIDVDLPDKTAQLEIINRINLSRRQIALRNKELEFLDTLVKAQFVEMFGNSSAGNKLGDFVYSIRTGKLDANAEEQDGIYPFFTCDVAPKRINKYAFNTEAILISGNGSRVGHVHYYSGKFNAYQRTYILSDFDEKVDIMFLKNYLENNLRPYIARNKKGSAVPYITLPMLQHFSIPVPSIDDQKIFSSFVHQVDKSKFAIQRLSLVLQKIKPLDHPCM